MVRKMFSADDPMVSVAKQRYWKRRRRTSIRPTGLPGNNSFTTSSILKQVSTYGRLTPPIPKPRRLCSTRHSMKSTDTSPDGKWIAYTSDESGTPQIYVVGFGKNSGRLQVSTHGGAQAMWRSDGKELYYVAADQKLMAVSVNTSAAVFQAGIPATLFQTSLSVGPLSYPEYVVASLGQRFLLSRPVQPAQSSPMTALLNWTAILSK